MAGLITHSWNGTILTITSDAGTSSMDLKGIKGDTGPRGPQGSCGIVIDDDGTLQLSAYATKEYVDDAIIAGGGGSGDLSNYYTKEETVALIDLMIDEALGAILSAEGGSY